MKEYVLPCLDVIDWSKVQPQAIEQCVWSPNKAPDASVKGIFLKDKAIVFCVESFNLPTRAVNTDPDSAVWEDSCLEFFFSFDGISYINLEANANSALRASFGEGRHNRKFLKDMDIPMPNVQAYKNEKSWQIIFSVPLELVEILWGKIPKSGDEFSANFYSCGDKTSEPHFASWSPVLTDTPDFHRPEYFGKIIIG